MRVWHGVCVCVCMCVCVYARLKVEKLDVDYCIVDSATIQHSRGQGRAFLVRELAKQAPRACKLNDK